jgi:cell wall-associated NlpC family hydrolase
LRKGRDVRRLALVCVAASVAAGAALFASYMAASAEEEGTAAKISQGSIAEHPVIEVSEGPSPGYSQVVDDATEGRFEAPGWGKRSGVDGYGGEYAYSSAGEGLARFKVEIPETGSYSVYARWPARAENGTAIRFGVSTVSGVKWAQVDQQKDGGMWVRLGAYELEAGDAYNIEVSAGSEGEAVADAVMVLSGEQANPEEAPAEETVFEASGGRSNGRDVVRKARWHLGTRYVESPPRPCRAFRKEDCSCHTKVVFRKFGKTLRDNPPDQWKRGMRVKKKSNLKPGDLVFFDENRNGKLQPWDHVGIYSGNGYLVHASGYFGEVVESKMKFIKGYWGAKRIKNLR